MLKYFAIYFCFFLWTISCQQKSATFKSVEPQEVQPMLSPDSTIINQTVEDVEPKTYLFTYNSVGSITIGDKIDDVLRAKKFEYILETATVYEEGTSYEVEKLIASDADGVLFEIIIYDGDLWVKEIHILSDRIKDDKSIGVWSSVHEFENAYSKANAYYTYEGNNVWLTNGFRGCQYVVTVTNEFIEQIDFESDLEELPLDKFTGTEMIEYIRLFGEPFQNDVSGSWSSQDGEVTSDIAYMNDTYHIELHTGEDIYQKFSQDLYTHYDMLYSNPTEEAQIQIQTYDFPHSITLTLDDRDEFEPLKAKLYRNP